MDHNIIKKWLSTHPPTLLNIYLLSIIFSQKDLSEDEPNVKKYFLKIVEILLIDKKITSFQEKELICKYSKQHEKLSEFHDIILSVSENPNLINDKWTEKNILIERTNKCFPCKKYGNIK